MVQLQPTLDANSQVLYPTRCRFQIKRRCSFINLSYFSVLFFLQTSLENFVLHQFQYQTCSTSIIKIGIVALVAINMDVTTTTTARVNKLENNLSFFFWLLLLKEWPINLEYMIQFTKSLEAFAEEILNKKYQTKIAHQCYFTT